MSNIKNKQTLYVVVRGLGVICAITKTAEFADILARRYEQQWKDVGASVKFHVEANTYYDE